MLYSKSPEPAAKREALGALARSHCLRVFVETGTYNGDMLDSLMPVFTELHSIELSRPLHDAALLRFAGFSKVHLYHGDSAETLHGLVHSLKQAPALFWLDAHLVPATEAAFSTKPSTSRTIWRNSNSRKSKRARNQKATVGAVAS